MNYIDKNFYALIEEFKNKDEIALYTHMYDKFKQINRFSLLYGK